VLYLSLPLLGGDIFIHAKSSSYSNLWELARLVVHSMPPGSVAKAEDIYGWQYKEGRDLSGFIDGESHDHHMSWHESHVISCAGTENPAEEDDRVRVAVSDKCGGSYCITQRWIHKHDVIASSKGQNSLFSLHEHSVRSSRMASSDCCLGEEWSLGRPYIHY
jgi:putative iron-dependent peroxidase